MSYRALDSIVSMMWKEDQATQEAAVRALVYDYAFKMVDLAIKMMDFVLKTMNFGRLISQLRLA